VETEFANVPPEQCSVNALSDTFHLSNKQLEDVMRRSCAESPVFYLDDIDF